MQRMRRIGWCGLLAVALLGACGGDDDSSMSPNPGSGGVGAGSGGTGSGGSTASGGSGGQVSSGSGGHTSAGTGGSGGTTSMMGAGGSGGSLSMDAGSGMHDAGGTADSGAHDAGAQDSGGSGGFSIESKAFADGSTIDMKYRCTGPSPDLKWSGAPAATKSYAIVMKDVTPAGTNTLDTAGTLHWIIYDIPASVMMLPEGVMVGYMPSAPMGAKQAPNYNAANGFQGPCYPFSPSTATYELTLYAIDVDTLPGLTMSSANTDVVMAISGHMLASTKLTIKSTT
jgi:Raf kinase inhibitor-like YbhB/YbcL family protein